jgi:hypothetical protein
LNGEYISTSGVVLRPGQRVFLERFLDSNNKFEFSTYKVKDTSENRSAIDLNGNVLIEFYDEQQVVNNFYLGGRTLYGSPSTIGYVPQFGTTITTTGGVTYGTTNLSNYNSTYTSSVTSDTFRSKFDTSSTLLRGPKKKSKSIETGRVEKGDESDQSFTNSYEQFNYHTSHTIKFKIQPLSNKNVTVEEIRSYCTECGTKMKKNYKFCPSCGNKL